MLVYLFINVAVFSILHKSSFVEYVTHHSSETQKFIKFLSHESCPVIECVPATFQEARDRTLLSTTSVPDTVLNTEVDDGIGCKDTGSGSSRFG